jgi:DNA segregation ATPase FtsK/SpoIIIE-like protein
VASLIAKNTVSSLRLAIVDPKILTFTSINGCPFLTQHVITDVKAAITLLKMAVSEMEKRYQSLAAEGQTSLKERWDAGMTDIPYFVLVFDEFADLILSDRDAKKAFEELVARISFSPTLRNPGSCSSGTLADVSGAPLAFPGPALLFAPD